MEYKNHLTRSHLLSVHALQVTLGFLKKVSVGKIAQEKVILLKRLRLWMLVNATRDLNGSHNSKVVGLIVQMHKDQTKPLKASTNASAALVINLIIPEKRVGLIV